MNSTSDIDRKLLEAWRKLRETAHEQVRHRLIQQINGLLDDRLGMVRNNDKSTISR